MGARTVGKGRGSVFVGGVRYDEGAKIPSDVNVGDHVFDDVDEVEGNIAMEAPKIVTVGPTESVDGTAARVRLTATSTRSSTGSVTTRPRQLRRSRRSRPSPSREEPGREVAVDRRR
jgi:hypothetical protein